MEFKPLLDFLKKLQKNNDKEWFDAHKKEYDGLRKEWLAYVSQLIKSTASFDPDIAPLEAKNCIFRINRDVRFSLDKSPYKNNFGMSLSKGGKKTEFCGYYLHIQPGECFVAGGAYSPMPDKLAAIRQEVDYNLDEFQKIVSAKDFKAQFGVLSGDKLSRPPKGYDAENPAVEFLKHKSFLAYKKITEKDLQDKGFEKDLLKTFKTMKSLNDFLNRAINH
jgi:uncharacterized protein (TIGR02453 family)